MSSVRADDLIGLPCCLEGGAAQSFCVPKDEIAEQGYDLSLNRYKELIHEEVEHRPPLEILAELRGIEQEILQGIDELEGMLR